MLADSNYLPILDSMKCTVICLHLAHGSRRDVRCQFELMANLKTLTRVLCFLNAPYFRDRTLKLDTGVPNSGTTCRFAANDDKPWTNKDLQDSK